MEKTIAVTVQGMSPLLMHAFPMLPIEAIEKKSPEQQAALVAYRNRGGELFIPGHAMQRALVAAAAFSKGKGRSTLVKIVAACVFVDPAELILHAPAGNRAVKSYEIDSRPVTVPATKGRVIRHRPRISQWRVSFTIRYDPDLLTGEQVRRVVDDAGSRVGVLDFRPERKGPFGRFSVVSWDSDFAAWRGEARRGAAGRGRARRGRAGQGEAVEAASASRARAGGHFPGERRTSYFAAGPGLWISRESRAVRCCDTSAG